MLSLQKRYLALSRFRRGNDTTLILHLRDFQVFREDSTRLHWRKAACELSLTTSSVRPAGQRPPSFLPLRVILQVPLLHITRRELKLVPNLLPSGPQIDEVVDIDLDLDHILEPRQPRPTLSRRLSKLPVPLGRQTEQRLATNAPQVVVAEYVAALQQPGERVGEIEFPLDNVVDAAVAAADEAGAAKGADELCRVCVQRLVEAGLALKVAARGSAGAVLVVVEVLGTDEARGVESGRVQPDGMHGAGVLEIEQSFLVWLVAQVVDLVGDGFPLLHARDCLFDDRLDAAQLLVGHHIDNVQPHVLLRCAALRVLHCSVLDPSPVLSVRVLIRRGWQAVVDLVQLADPVS